MHTLTCTQHLVKSGQEPTITDGPDGSTVEVKYSNSQTSDNGTIYIRAKEFIYRGAQFTELHQQARKTVLHVHVAIECMCVI